MEMEFSESPEIEERDGKFYISNDDVVAKSELITAQTNIQDLTNKLGDASEKLSSFGDYTVEGINEMKNKLAAFLSTRESSSLTEKIKKWLLKLADVI